MYEEEYASTFRKTYFDGLSRAMMECMEAAVMNGGVHRSDWHGSVHALVRRGLLVWSGCDGLAVPSMPGYSIFSDPEIRFAEVKIQGIVRFRPVCDDC